MRKVLIAILASFALVVALAVPANAGTYPGSCRLSANWLVNASATWYSGDLAYVVLTSPGPLFYGTEAETKAVGGLQTVRFFARVGTGTNPYTYRANFTNADQHDYVNVYVESYPNSVNCHTLIYGQ